MLQFYGKTCNYCFATQGNGSMYDVAIYPTKELARKQDFHSFKDSEYFKDIDSCIGWAVYWLLNGYEKNRWYCVKVFNPNMEIEKEYYEKNALLEDLWKTLEDINIDEQKCIEQDWFIFEKGTYREEIWNWFDEQHSKGVGWLMNEMEV